MYNMQSSAILSLLEVPLKTDLKSLIFQTLVTGLFAVSYI